MNKVKLKLTWREMQALTFWITERLNSEVHTEQLVYEYLLATGLQQLQQRLYKKMDSIMYTGTDTSKQHSVGVQKSEILILNIFYKRFGSTIFLEPVFTQLNGQIARHSELVDVLMNKRPNR